MSDAEIGIVVKEAVRRATCPLEAIEKIRLIFPEGRPIWVQTRGLYQWEVFLQPYPDSNHHSFICDRERPLHAQS